MRQLLPLLLLLNLLPLDGVGQRLEASDMIRERKGVLRFEEWAGLLTFHTNGMALGARRSKIEKYYLNLFSQYEIANIKHTREVFRAIDPAGSRRGLYTFGKQNSLLALRLSRGKVKFSSEKARTGNVGIGWMYAGGVTFGFVKPYYLLVRTGPDGISDTEAIKYSEETEAQFLDQTRIVKQAQFFTGLKETKLIPGAHIQGGLHMTFRGNTALVFDVELGVKGDVFLQSIPLMVTEQNRPFYVSLFISVQIGKRK